MKYFLWSLLYVIRTLEIWLENVDAEKDTKDIKGNGPNNQPSMPEKNLDTTSPKVVEENSTGKSDCDSE